MKVLELCLSTGVGGLEHYAIRTAKQLHDRGIECVAVVASNTMTAERMAQQSIETLVLERRSKLLPIIAAKKLANIIDNLRIDIVHLHWSNDFNLAALAKRFAKRPVKLIYTRQMMLTRPKHDAYHRFLYRHVDLLLTITDELCQKARRFLPMPAKKIRTLYYGVEKPPQLSDGQRFELRKGFGIKDDCFAIGMIGRIEEGKGQHLVIDAVDQLTRQGHRIHATIIGPAMADPYEEELKQRVHEQGLDQQVTFYGSHPNPVEIMSAFDVVILATRQETFGLVLVEAMRNGVAVIGTNAGGVPEIIDHGKTGLLFEPDNAKDLADKLLQLIQDTPLRQTLARAGRQKADELFSQERHYELLIQSMRALVTD